VRAQPATDARYASRARGAGPSRSAFLSAFFSLVGLHGAILLAYVGNMHGVLKSMLSGDARKHLDIERIRAIKDRTRIFMTCTPARTRPMPIFAEQSPRV
jgi:hypothetical protein